MSYKTDVPTFVSVDSARTDEILASIGDSIFQIAEDEVFANQDVKSCVLHARIASVSSDLESRRSDDPCYYFIDRSNSVDARAYEVQLRVSVLPSWDNYVPISNDSGCPLKLDVWIHVNLLMVDDSTLGSSEGEYDSLLERLVRIQEGSRPPYTF